MRISDWSSDVCSSDLQGVRFGLRRQRRRQRDGGRGVAGGRFKDQRVRRRAALAELGRNHFRMAGVRHHIGRPERRLVDAPRRRLQQRVRRSEEHTSELQSLMRISYAVFCLKKKNKIELLSIKLTITIRTGAQQT